MIDQQEKKKIAHTVDCSDGLPALNKAIELPKKLTCEDGREFEIIEWAPTVNVERPVTVDVKLVVMVTR